VGVGCEDDRRVSAQAAEARINQTVSGGDADNISRCVQVARDAVVAGQASHCAAAILVHGDGTRGASAHWVDFIRHMMDNCCCL
jgi:hypothetical protein